MKSFVVFALAAAAAALPQKRTLLSFSEFTLQMRLGYGDSSTLMKLCAEFNGTNDYLLLVATDGSGSPAYFNGSSPNAALNLDVNGVSYGIGVGDTGDIHGIAEIITAEKGYQDPNFIYGDSSNEINHQLTSAAPTWLACNRTVNDVVVPVLSWGSYYNNGSYPYGCQSTALFRSCDIPGSTASKRSYSCIMNGIRCSPHDLNNNVSI